HGCAATDLLHGECAAVRYVSAGYVLEANDGPRRFYRASGRHGRGPAASRAFHSGRRSAWLARRMDSHRSHLSVRHGAELLDGNLCVQRQYAGYGDSVAGDEATTRDGTGWSRLFADAKARRGPSELVSEARDAGPGSAGDSRRAQFGIRITPKGKHHGLGYS